MTSPEFIGLEDVPFSVADEQWWLQQNSGIVIPPQSASPESPALRVVDFTTFVSTEEPSAEPLLGTSTETLLPADGMLLMYGDGGAGKTTLTIDAVTHLASGSNWLGISVERPIRTLLIENEGPRGKFRQMLAEKQVNWNGTPFHQNVSVLEEPWTRFTMRDPAHRAGLAETIGKQEIDLLVMGPLVTLGMVGGGTPDEISEFEGLLRAFRELVPKPVALWIVHHENKQGDVSGAWERVPDTLVHVQAQGNGHTRLIWRKARWSSENHGKGIELVWADGRSFTVRDEPERDPWQEMEVAFRHANGWRTAKEAGKLIHLTEAQAKKVLADLVRRGVFEFEKGPHGRSATANCWRLLDGVESTLQGARDDSAHLRAPGSKTLTEEQVRGCAPPVRGAAAQRAPADEGATARADLRAPCAVNDDDDDDGIPF